MAHSSLFWAALLAVDLLATASKASLSSWFSVNFVTFELGFCLFLFSDVPAAAFWVSFFGVLPQG